MVLSLILIGLAAVHYALGASYIVPGAVWYDTDGNKIDAHGGGVFKRGSTFYWLGYRATDQLPNMYSSTDLINWSKIGTVSSSACWRPKYAKPNGSFWIYCQQDRNVLSLKSSSLTSGYTQVAKGLLPPNQYSYSDTGMFLDPVSNTYYLLTSADHNTVQINMINADGSIGNLQSSITKGSLEAPGIFYESGYYYIILSGKTGYRPNPNKVYYSTSLSGPWSGGTDIAPVAENTYGSQNSFELTIAGSQKTTHIYMGDAWTSGGGADSNYVWLPISVDTGSHTATLSYYPQWKIDVNTGVVSGVSSKRRYEAEHGALSGRAIIKTCDSCLNKRAVHGVDHNSEVTFYNVTGTGSMEYVTIHYQVNNPKAGEARIYLNDNRAPIVLSDLNVRAGYHGSIPVPLRLMPGDVNTITFGATGHSDYEVIIEAIELHE